MKRSLPEHGKAPHCLLYLIETFQEFCDLAGCNNAFYAPSQNKTYASIWGNDLTTQEAASLRLSVWVYSLEILIASAPGQISPYRGLCFWAEFSIYVHWGRWPLHIPDLPWVEHTSVNNSSSFQWELNWTVEMGRISISLSRARKHVIHSRREGGLQALFLLKCIFYC